MARVKLLHNAKAGDESHSEKKLISMIESKGFICDYSSVKSRDWEIPAETDFVVVAGGDGTVKRTARKLLERQLLEKQFPIAILPLGTANNLSRSLDIGDDTVQIIESWTKPKITKFDIGRIYGQDEYPFFMEGMGYGIFPNLIHKMKSVDDDLSEDPEKRILAALKLLHKITLSYKPHHAHIVIDGKDHSGDYLMVEIMNIPSIGPNLMMAPKADSSDGFFDIVLINDGQRDALASYVENRIKGKETALRIEPIRGKEVYIKWQGPEGHIDDKLIRTENHPEIKIDNHRGLLTFFS